MTYTATSGTTRAFAAELCIVAAVAAAYLFLSFHRDGTFIWLLRQSEGGMWLDEAVRVLGGEHIYRDFFDFIAPGNVFLIAGFLRVFGATPSAVGALVVSLGVIATLLVHAVGSRLMSRAWRLCATAVFVIYVYQPYSPLNHKWPTLILCLAAILLLVDSRDGIRSALAGVFAAMATLCTQDMGAGAAVGIGVALWLLRARDSLRPLALFCAAYALVVMLALLALAIDAGADTIWYDLFLFPAAQYHNANKFSVDFGEPHAAARTLTIYGLCALGLVCAALGLARRGWRERPPAWVLVSSVGLAFLAASLTRQIELSLGARAFPLMILGVWFLSVQIGRWARPALAFFILTLGGTAVLQLLDAQRMRPLVLASHRAGEIWEPLPMEDLAWLERHAAAGELVFLFPSKGGHLFLSRTRSATAFPLVLDLDFTPPTQLRQAAAQIAAQCPPVGLWDHGRVFTSGEHSSLRELYAAILRNYESRGRVAGDIELFARSADPKRGCRA
jgi:hypothetical protein